MSEAKVEQSTWFRPGWSMAVVGILTFVATLLIHLFATPDLALPNLVGHAFSIGAAYTIGFILAYFPIASLWLKAQRDRALPTWLLITASLGGMLLGFLILTASHAFGFEDASGGHEDRDWIFRLLPVAIILMALFLASERTRQMRLELARLGTSTPGDRIPALLTDIIELQAGRTMVVVRAEEILRVAAQENYCEVVLKDGRSHLIRSPLAEMLARLPETAFVQTHRSHIVNIDRINRIEPSGRAYAAILGDNGGTVPVSRGYVEGVTEAWRKRKQLTA